MSIHKQQNKEGLSAFLDAEQSDSETSRIVDALLNDPVYKEQYIRFQLMNDHLHDQVHSNAVNKGLRDNISLALADLPGHFVDDAVALQTAKTENIIQSSWFNRFVDNRMLSGVSIAASVMLVTLFTLQGFNSQSNMTNTMADNSLAGTTQISTQISTSPNQQTLVIPMPSLIQSASELPASYVSTDMLFSRTAPTGNDDLKQQYQWIEADPTLSQQVRQYVKEHEIHRAAYNLQPQIRTATYQLND